MTELPFSFHFDNRFVAELPGDKIDEPQNPRQVHNAAYSWAKMRKASVPKLLAHSSELAAELGIDEEAVKSDFFSAVFCGNTIVPGMQPYAMCYGGHQFGNWAGQLGDGRAINLGEVKLDNSFIDTASKQTISRYALQLKGAGRTPYSRTADGLAVLRSSLREFICSEAMHALGVPTTRALSLCTTGDEVLRDMLYDGNPAYEPGAVVCRVAPSFIRFGNFELPSSRRDFDLLQQLCEHCITTDFPEIWQKHKRLSSECMLEWFQEVCARTATLMVHWQRVGFVHGVMNTDNLSILGLTIDYGPYGWLEEFDPDWTPNTTDAAHHRYAFAKQGQIAHWNLAMLGNALLPLAIQIVCEEAGIEVDSDDEKTQHMQESCVGTYQETLHNYAAAYQKQWQEMMLNKLGIQYEKIEQTHEDCIEEILSLLQILHFDYLLFFRTLAKEQHSFIEIEDNFVGDTLRNTFRNVSYAPELFTKDNAHWIRFSIWLKKYAQLLQADSRSAKERIATMNSLNPKYAPRNYLAQEAIDDASTGDLTKLHRLQKALRNPYDEQDEYEDLARMRPEWATQKVGCSQLSCSS